MPAAKCTNCGETYHGWALEQERHRVCGTCGHPLAIITNPDEIAKEVNMPCPKCTEGILRDTLAEGGTESEMCDRCGYPHDDPGTREFGQESLPMGNEEQERILFD